MLHTSVSRPFSSCKVCARADTSVVFPAPWTPLRPMKKGPDGFAAWWTERRERMKGMQCGDLSSMMASGVNGGAAIVEGGVWERE